MTHGVEERHKVGEQPGAGTYACTSCESEVTLKTQAEPLPPCPQCGIGTGEGVTYRPLYWM